jgi:metal-sulfur cluster biosynthetic enzyme
MNDEILAVLKTVIDPELGINIVDLGLVYHAERTDNVIDIALTMTTPACPLGEMMSEEIKRVLGERFPDVSDIRVDIVWDPPWSARPHERGVTPAARHDLATIIEQSFTMQRAVSNECPDHRRPDHRAAHSIGPMAAAEQALAFGLTCFHVILDMHV